MMSPYTGIQIVVICREIKIKKLNFFLLKIEAKIKENHEIM